MSSRFSPARAIPLVATMLALSACDSNGGTGTTIVDAGTTTLTCSTTSDCQGTGVCVAGLCEAVESCMSDEDCAADGKVCHSQRFFCVECDGRTGQCAEGQTCQFDFTCVSSSSGSDAGVSDGGSQCTGSCADRTECASDAICRDGACCPPPSRCSSAEDCPTSAPQCNGATGQCFGGSGCFSDSECESETGCAGGACFCNISGSPPGTCELKPDECQTDPDCYDNGAYAMKYCALAGTPKLCQNAPSCSTDADCASLGLVCDLTAGSPSQGYCINGIECPNGTECPNGQVCVAGRCAGANCITQPSLCTSTQMCDTATGMCVDIMTGACTVDTDCATGQYCNTAVGQCQTGCRSNADCGTGVCNAAHMCEYPNNALCGPCSSDADCPGGTECVDIAGTSLCREGCLLSQTCTIDTTRTCVLAYCSCLL